MKINNFSKWLLLMGIIIIPALHFSGCNAEKKQEQYPPPVPEVKQLPLDYVFLIDNSGSIPKGEPRRFAREAIKAFIELSETNDKISIILFDKNAKLISHQLIRGILSKNNIINSLNKDLNFNGNYTDISAGMRLLKQNENIIFREKGTSNRVVILISDGKLEPKANLAKSFNTLNRDYSALAQTCTFYTLGISGKSIHDIFFQNIDGETLLKNLAQNSDGQFFPIKNIGNLMDALIKLIKITKGYGELKEKNIFWTDESTKRLVFLVVKRLPNQQLYLTKNIRIQDNKNNLINISNYQRYEKQIIWRQGYYYDLIVIEQPLIGNWAITLENGLPPKVIIFMKNQIHLRYKYQKQYWTQERKYIFAWLYDERINAISDKSYQISADFDSVKVFPWRNVIPLRENKNKSYASVFSLNHKNPPTGNYYLQFQAVDSNSYFFRRSPWLVIKIKKGYFHFDTLENVINTYPLFNKQIIFSTILFPNHDEYPEFEEYPEISIHLCKIDDGKPIPYLIQKLRYEVSNNNLKYYGKAKKLHTGKYVAFYKLSGTLRSGKKVNIQSIDFTFKVVWPIWVWIIIGILILLIIYLFLFLTRPKLKGKLDFIEPVNRSSILLKKHKKAKSRIKGDTLYFGGKGNEMPDLQFNSFILFTRRKKKLLFKKIRGNFELIRDNRTLQISRITEIYKNDILCFTDNQTHYKIKVIWPKKAPIKHR